MVWRIEKSKKKMKQNGMTRMGGANGAQTQSKSENATFLGSFFKKSLKLIPEL